MAFTGKEIQEFFANFGTCKVQFNRHLILLYAVGARFLLSSIIHFDTFPRPSIGADYAY